jgi:hypothetical protein
VLRKFGARGALPSWFTGWLGLGHPGSIREGAVQ